jgi:hypothetical protein
MRDALMDKYYIYLEWGFFWTRILCVYWAGACPFDLVASFKVGDHKSNVKSVERRGIKIKMTCNSQSLLINTPVRACVGSSLSIVIVKIDYFLGSLLFFSSIFFISVYFVLFSLTLFCFRWFCFVFVDFVSFVSLLFRFSLERCPCIRLLVSGMSFLIIE